MRILSENYQCDCGTHFEWKTLFLQSGEAMFGRWDELNKNVIDKDIINKQYHITVRFPKCNRRHFIVKE